MTSFKSEFERRSENKSSLEPETFSKLVQLKVRPGHCNETFRTRMIFSRTKIAQQISSLKSLTQMLQAIKTSFESSSAESSDPL